MLKYSEYRMSKQHEMLKLASNPKNVAQVEPFIEKVFNSYQLNPDMYGNILITLTEAVTNAIVHGNDRDESKLVRVRLQHSQKCLAFKVSDEGGGFDFENLPDPTSPENILKIPNMVPSALAKKDARAPESIPGTGTWTPTR